ncbi:hypothetical protein A4X13_0g9578 [Tilletia indica]|uniref:Uncharacterized protein n=1 Tax=Tilletia indica TaxID=43049 RepID=A0A177T3C3_9BASI|nr:hypothetical protein A4X13_0g9578 [Tilletia indica]
MSDQEVNDNDSDEEYEIEQVLDCDYERFEQRKWAYLVSWKGYRPEDNSWVREDDAENASEMLEEFWAQNASKREAVEAAIAAKNAKASASKKQSKEDLAKRRLAGVGEWDPLVETVETVERKENGELVVFLTFITGEQVAYQSEVCRTRCPQALIKFYERHLRFRDTTAAAASASATDAAANGTPVKMALEEEA